ncbi:hypothetical protein IC575_006285 [Cucumis melo]
MPLIWWRNSATDGFSNCCKSFNKHKTHRFVMRCSDDITKARKIPKRALPIICFKEVSPPLSDASNTSIIDSGYLT